MLLIKFQDSQPTEEFCQDLSSQINIQVQLSKTSQVSVHFKSDFKVKYFQRSKNFDYRRKGNLVSTNNENANGLLLLEVDTWPVFNHLRVQLNPVEFLRSENSTGESLWVHLAKWDQNHTFDFNFEKVVARIGVRLSFSDEKKFFHHFGYGLNIEIWKRNATECFKISTLYKSKYKKVGYKTHFLA